MADQFRPFVGHNAVPVADPVSVASLVAAIRASEDDDDKKKKDDAKAKNKAAEDDDDKKKDDDKAKSKKAEGEDDEEMKKAKKAKAKEDDEDDDKDDKKSRAATAAERARVLAILDIGLSPANAVHLIEEGASMAEIRRTQMIVAAITPPAPAPVAKVTHAERMASVTAALPIVGAGDGDGREPTLAEKIVLAGRRARGEI